MPQKRTCVRAILLSALLLVVAFALFRCPILVLIDDVFGTEWKPQIAVVDSDSSLTTALQNDDCILLVSHRWSIEDDFIRKQLAREIACTQKLGRFRIFLLRPSDPDKDNGESDAMHERLDRLCGTNGDLPKFHRYVKSSGMTFIKSGDRMEWIPRVWTFDNLKEVAIEYTTNAESAAVSGDWRRLRLGDRIRFLRMPPSFSRPDYYFPPERLALYELLIRTGNSAEVEGFTADGIPWASYVEQRNAEEPVIHKFMIDFTDEGCWERVLTNE